jgi:hypothetical protein
VYQGTFTNDPKQVAQWIADLDSEDFAARERASKALQNLGRVAVPSLRAALAATESLEAKRRLERLVAEAAKPTAPEVLRVERVLETLELMGGPEAREALETLAKGPQGAWLCQVASESLRRQREKKR